MTIISDANPKYNGISRVISKDVTIKPKLVNKREGSNRIRWKGLGQSKADFLTVSKIGLS